MTSFRNKYLFLILSLIIAAWLVVAQVIANQILILTCLVAFLAVAVFAGVKKMALPVLLFFIPWAPILKNTPESFSFYTIALLAILLICLISEYRRIDPIHIILAFFLLLISLIPKIGNGYSIDNSYILFFACLFLIHLLGNEFNDGYDFYVLSVFFILGIITSALSANQLAVIPTISRYITVLNYSGLTRYCGYYGDPNFYSAHITAAISGLMVMSVYEKGILRRLFMFVSAVLLIYCGFLSASKSFIVILVCLFLFWILEILFMRRKMSFKVVLILTLFVGLIFVLSSTVFTDLIDMVIGRFKNDNNISSLTTGRTDIWIKYLNALISDVKLLFFGQGFTSIIIGDRISHNTIIQILYQFGVFGTPLLLAWIWRFFKKMLGSARIEYGMLQNLLILLIGVFGPWMALDQLFFDDFFLMQFFVCMGIRYIAEKRAAEAEKSL